MGHKTRLRRSLFKNSRTISFNSVRSTWCVWVGTKFSRSWSVPVESPLSTCFLVLCSQKKPCYKTLFFICFIIVFGLAYFACFLKVLFFCCSTQSQECLSASICTSPSMVTSTQLQFRSESATSVCAVFGAEGWPTEEEWERESGGRRWALWAGPI